jgi:hypothetical protein
MGWLQSIQRAFWSVGSSTYDAVHAQKQAAGATGILRARTASCPTERRKLLSATRTLHRNFSVAAWMIRKHLDYVSTFSFQARTGNNELDDSSNGWCGGGRSPELRRDGPLWTPAVHALAEMRRTVDGDMGV